MPRFTQMMDVIFGLTHWVDFTNDINGLSNEIQETEASTPTELEKLNNIVTE
ncbi:hypothetical protein [Litchfieldia salsa]|uniref:Uncharacterized protein n=1 Tax=Litchfieldia salsa TaxID=930152 RepID=A0A1H0X1W6_9BACI|nr:hypothetical protein [Litchfieldia salsa]SDP96948.1 hypothetical protein SAMN05216565_1247 [Litchfieldia salsa]